MKIEIDSAFMTRLLDVVASGVGALARPWMIRRIANADADALRIKARAEEEVRLLVEKNAIELDRLAAADQQALLPPGPDPIVGLRQRALARVEERELRRMHNIEAVVAIAATQEGPQPPDEAPAPDWVARFFTSVQDVSVEEMQTLWGKILAGEIRQPGSYSLRTLDVVRNLSRSEAELFAEAAGYLEATSGSLIWGPRSRRHLPNLLPLVESGLLHVYAWWMCRSPRVMSYPPDSLHIVLDGPGAMDRHDITEAARQLLSIVTVGQRAAAFVDDLAQDLMAAGYNVTRPAPSPPR